MLVQPNDALYANHSIAPTNGVVQTTPGVLFQILVANFGKHRKSLVKNQVLGTLLPHPVAMYPSNVMLASVLGLPKPRLGENTASNANHPPQPEATEPPKEQTTSIDELDLAHVPEQHRARLRKLLRKYSSMWDGSLGETNMTEHSIELQPGTKPIAQPPYRAGPRLFRPCSVLQRQAEQAEVDRMLEQGVIEPTQSAWAYPVLLVPKPDGSLRFCVGYRRLNAVTIRESYPLPRMDECIDSLGDPNVFTTLDCNSGY